MGHRGAALTARGWEGRRLEAARSRDRTDLPATTSTHPATVRKTQWLAGFSIFHCPPSSAMYPYPRFGDLDPSGLDLQRAWEEALDNFRVLCTFVRIGLTPVQVDDRDLDQFAIEVEPSDSRSTADVEEYGERCWEADVLSADVIEQALDDEIRSWLDNDIWRRRDAEIERTARASGGMNSE